MSGRALAQGKAALTGAALLFLAAGCAHFASPDDHDRVVANALAQGLVATTIVAGPFRLAAYLPGQATAGDVLTLYVEGDGAPWPTTYQPPRDPTPRRPVGLALAGADRTGMAAYLARPCQYLAESALRDCDTAYWTNRRFAPEVIAAYEEATDQLKARTGARKIRLVGYSGGGVIATLLAARRTDVEQLVTVAAPLALGEWTSWHGVSELTGSLDPLAAAATLPPGLHFSGGKDKTVPTAILRRFTQRHGGRAVEIADFDHECCWSRDWRKLLQQHVFR